VGATARSRRGGPPAPAPEAGASDGGISGGSVLHIPSNPAAERAVLGAILTDDQGFFRIVELLNADDFYDDAHRLVFEAFAALASSNRNIDLLTTSDQLGKGGVLAQAGGVAYLTSLIEGLPDAANIEHYANIVRERSVKRQLLKISQVLLASCAREEGGALEALDNAESQLLAIAERAMRGGPKAIGDLVHAEVDHIERVSHSSAPYTGIETGFYRLDELTSGLQKQDLVILAARPGVGKTALALNIAANCAVRGGLKVAVFSLEMSGHALTRRLLSSEARINLKRLSRGLLSRSPHSQETHQGLSDWQRLAEAADRLAETKMWIDDAAAISVLELRGKCRRLAMEHDGLDLVIVDYLQLMSSGARAENRTQEVSAISRGLKAVAKQLNVPMLVISQLSRNPERRTDQRPQLSDLRESGSIEQDADVVIFINRKNRALVGPEDNEEEEDLRLAEIIIAKQRNGPTDLFKLVYMDEFTRFENPELGSYER
jgi:replicative DNA helicase